MTVRNFLVGLVGGDIDIDRMRVDRKIGQPSKYEEVRAAPGPSDCSCQDLRPGDQVISSQRVECGAKPLFSLSYSGVVQKTFSCVL